MKKVIGLFMAILIAFALVGCNIAPNVPRVTPYATGGTDNYNYNNANNNTNRAPIINNATDKDLVPYVSAR